MSEKLIMIVDDDPGIVAFMTDFLTLYEYAVSTVRRSCQVIEQIHQQQPDLVVLDHRLDAPPNGWEIFLELRAEPTTAGLPVIFYSAEQMILQMHRDTVRSMGGDVLDKPFKMETLLAKIETLLNTAMH